MIITIIVYFSFAGFIGYVIGRWGDNYLNFWLKDPDWTPDHWIYGFFLMAYSLLFLINIWGLYLFSFGLGLLISDLKDCLDLKFYGSDKKEKSQRKFWHID